MAVMMVMQEWCLCQWILWLWEIVGLEALLTTFQQCRGVNSCFHSIWDPLPSIFILREDSPEEGLPSFWIWPNPVSRTDADVTKAPTSNSLVSDHHQNDGKHCFPSQNMLAPNIFHGGLLLLHNSLNSSREKCTSM